MKNVLLGLNVVLLAAVGYLFYLHYNSDPKPVSVKAAETQADALKTTVSIAYFELDSLENNYEYAKEVKSYLTRKDRENASSLNKLKNNFNEKYKEYQQKGPNLSQNEQSEYQQELMKLQNNYAETEQKLTASMNTEAIEKMQQVKMKIQDYLKNYCANKGLTYVFASSADDYLYYKDTVRNITSEIISGLNEEYKTGKNK